MLKFAKSVPYIPDPQRSRPHVTAADRAAAAEQPPQAVPFHCKPWVDGQSLGWTLFYGWLTPITITGGPDGRIAVTNLAQLAAETQQPAIVDQFAAAHFGIGTGYTLQTPPGLVALILPPVDPPPHLETIVGVVETDWYPRQLFLVFRTPAPGVAVSLDYRMALARVVLVPRHDGLQAQPLDDVELAALAEQAAAYDRDEATSPTRWTAAGGATFAHVYKQWSRRRQESADDA